MNATKTAPDWLRFRHQGEVLEGLEAMRGLFGSRGPTLKIKSLERGKDGFQSACSVHLGEYTMGRIDFGGVSQRGWVRVNLTGVGCENVQDWDAAADVEALPASQITRLDLALTTWKREVLHQTVVDAHEAGLFACGGRPPALQQITSSDPNAGRTCTVGKRDADKYFRGYEKGLELLHKWGMSADQISCIDAYPVHDIYRCEVELKAKASIIPWEAIERRDHYFAGCYPFLAKLLPGVESDALMRRPERAPQTALKVALANCRIQYGATLYTALAAYGGDFMRVWDEVCGSKHNEALLSAGVLEFNHDD
jgi:DNA relaxase NicK